MFNNWTGKSLLRAAFNKLTPKNWAQNGDFHQHGIFQNYDESPSKHCIVGMCAVILGCDDEEAESFLKEAGLPVSDIENANDNAANLAKFERDLRDNLGIAF